jgi:hypothetical protein
MLKELISWREITDQDLANVDLDSPTCLNEEEIFPRNAISRLFNYYYQTKNTEEIERFMELIISKCKESDHYYLFYSKAFRKIITFLKKSGDFPKAKQLCERYLTNLGVLENKSGEIRVSSFGWWQGNYSYSYPVVFMEVYLRILIQMGEIHSAERLADECINDSTLMEDSRIIFKEFKQKLSGGKTKPPYPIIKVKRGNLKANHTDKGRVELIALSYLQEELDMEGIFAEVDIWRLFPSVISHKLPETDFKTLYEEIVIVKPPEDVYDFILHNSETFKNIIMAENVTFNMVGYPDLILYKKDNYGDFLLVEVKDINDRLSPPQQAWVRYFVKNRIPFRLFQFIK